MLKTLSLKLEHQDPQLPSTTFRMPKESGTSGEISSTPRRCDQGFVEAIADTKSCFGHIGVPGVMEFRRKYRSLSANIA